MKKFSVELNEEHYLQLKGLAAAEFRSTKATAEMVLIKYLERESCKRTIKMEN